MSFHDEAADWLKEILAKARAGWLASRRYARSSRPTHPETREALPPPSVGVTPAPSYPHQPPSQVATAFRRRTGRDPAPPRAPVRQLPVRRAPESNIAQFLREGGVRPDVSSTRLPLTTPRAVTPRMVAQQPEPVTPSGWQDLLGKVTPDQWGFAGDAWKYFETARTAANLLSPGGAQTGRGLRQYERLPPEQQQRLAYGIAATTPLGAILGRGAPAAARLAPTVAGRTVPPLLKLAGQAAKGWKSGAVKTMAPIVAQDLASRAQETDRAKKMGQAEEAVISPEHLAIGAGKEKEMRMNPLAENVARRWEELGEAPDKPVTEKEARSAILFKKSPQRELAIYGMADPDDLPETMPAQIYSDDYKLHPGQEPTPGLVARRRLAAATGIGWDAWQAAWNSAARGVGAAYYLADRYGTAGLNPFTGEVTRDGVTTEIDRKRAWEVGQEYFQMTVPLHIQMMAPFMLDPLRAFIHPLRNAKHIKLMRDTFKRQLVALSTESALKVPQAIKAGTAFFSQPVARILDQVPALKKVIRRAPATNSRLAAEATNRHLETLVIGRTPKEVEEILTGVELYHAGRLDEAHEILKQYPQLLRRTPTPAEASLLGSAAKNAMVSVLDSLDGQIASLVLGNMKGPQIRTLLNIIGRGVGPSSKVKPAARAASEQAAIKLLELFARATDEISGNLKLTKVEQAGAVPKWIGEVIRYGDRAMAAYQGVLARWTQLNSFGRVGRDAMVSVTEGLMDGVLGPVPRNWYDDVWRSSPASIKRGVGPGGERLAIGTAQLGAPGYVSGLVPERVRKLFGFGAGRPRTVGKIEAKMGKKSPMLAATLGRSADIVIEMPGQWKKIQENKFAEMPVYVGIKKVFNAIWRPREALRPTTRTELVAAIGEPRADELIALAEGAWHPNDLTRVEEVILGGRSHSVSPEINRALRDADIDPKVIRRMQKAEDIVEVRAIRREEELRILNDGTDLHPGTLEGSDETVEALRKEYVSQGYSSHQIEQYIHEDMTLRSITRGVRDAAKSAAYDSIDNITDPVKKNEALNKFFALEGEHRTATNAVVAEVTVNRRAAQEGGYSYFELNGAIWDEHFAKLADDYHTLRLDVDPFVAEAMRYDDTVVRATADGLRQRNISPITEAQQLSLDDYFQAGGRFESAAADVIDPVINAAAAKPLKIRALRRAATHIINRWDAFPQAKLTPQQVKAVRQAVTEMKAGLNQVRGVAEGFGTALRDMTYYNYGDKRNFDILFRWIGAYPHWYSRQAMRSAYRFLENPHAVVALHKMRASIEGLNEDAPEWLKPYIRKTMGNGGLLSIPVMQYVDPQDSFIRSDFHSPEIMKTASGRVYTAANDWGPGSTHSAWPLILGAIALKNGNKELARSYVGRLGLATTFVGEVSSAVGTMTGIDTPELALEHYLPGPYQLMNVDTPEGEKFVGTKYDMDEVGKLLIAKADNGAISQALLQEIMFIVNDPFNEKYMDDPTYQAAYLVFMNTIDEMRRNKIYIPGGKGDQLPGGTAQPGILGPLLMSFLVGPAFRYDSATEVAIMEAQQKYGELRNEMDRLYATGSEVDKEKARQLQRGFWTDPANQKYSNLLTWRNKGDDRLEAYAWNVHSRTGPGIVDNKLKGPNGADINYELLHEFYYVGGIPEDWKQTEKDTFIADVMKLGAVLELPDVPTRNEWRKVTDERAKLMDQLYAGVDQQTVKDFEKYKYNDESIKGNVNQWLEARPQVQALLDKELQLVMNHELVAAYYASQKMVTDYYWKLWEMEHAEGYEANKFYYEHADFYGKERADAWKKNEGKDRVIAEYWDARNEYKNTGLLEDVRNFESGLPDTRLWELREGIDPDRDIFTENVVNLVAERRNPAVALEEADMGGMPSDAHRAAYDRNKDLSTETWMDTLKPDYDIGFGQFIDDNDINQALWNQYEEISLFDRFPVSGKGVPGIVAYVQQNGGGSIREAMMTETMGGHFTKDLMAWRVLGTIQNLPYEELEKLKLQYPELSDVDMVYWALYGEAEPTLGILLKSMGLSGSVTVDGEAKTNKVSGITALTPEQVFKKEDIFGSLVIDEDNKFLDTGDVHEVVRRIAAQYIEPGIERQYETYRALHTALQFAEADAMIEANPNIEKFMLLKEMVFANFNASSLIPGSDKWVKFRKEMDSTLKTGGIEAMLKLIDEKGLKAVKGLVKDVKKGARITRTPRTPRTRSSRGRTTRSILYDFHALRTAAIEATQRRQAQRQQAPPEQAPPDLTPWLSIHAKWTQEKNPILVMLMDYFDLSAYARQAHLQRNPDLARWLSTVPAAQLAAIEQAYYIWAQQTGRLTPRQERRVSRSRPALASTLRVYKPRGERAGI